MERDLDAGIASHNYYARLNQLLGRPADAGMPTGFEAVAGFWQDLSSWLDEDLVGSRGKSTIRPHHWHVYVGYAISQALLRRVDRNRLTDFFRSAGLQPGDEITAEELWALLHIWARDGSGLTSYGLHAILSADDRLAGALSEVVKSEFDAWDGALRDAEGRQVATVALRLRPQAGWRKIELSLLPRRPEGFPAGAFSSIGGRTYELTSSKEGWYDELDVAVEQRLLERGMAIRRGRFAIQFQPMPVMPFRASIELGGWVSVPRLVALEEHCLLVHVSKMKDVERLLARGGDGGHQLIQAAGLPPHWRVIRAVRVTEESTSRDPGIGRVTPRTGLTARLEGGLEVAPSGFLTEGEPDLWVSVTTGDNIEVEVDEIQYRWPETVKRVELRKLSLGAGDHQVKAAGRTLRFTSYDGLTARTEQDRDVLGYELESHGTYKPTAASAVQLEPGSCKGAVRIVGAAAMGSEDDLPLPLEPPVLLRHGFTSYVVLGKTPGEVVVTEEPSIPPWLEAGLSDEVCQFFDVPCPFEAELVLMKSADGWLVRAIRRRPRAATRDAQAPRVEAVEAWQRTILEADERDAVVPPELSKVWSTYVETARERSA